MAKLYDYMPKQDESGRPVYRIYWVLKQYRKSDEERPWLEVVVDPEGLHCYAVSHQEPWRDEENYFKISKDHEDFKMTALARDTDSWVDASYRCTFPKGVSMRREGLVTGKLAVEFKEWLDKRARGKQRGINPPLSELLRNEEIFIVPWIYTGLGFEAVTFFECAAVEAYRGARSSARIPEGTCFYDGAKDVLVRHSGGVPGLSWWVRAYMDYTWVRLLHRDVKAEWRGLISKRKNSSAAAYLMEMYVLHVRHYEGGEELTAESFARATLAEAAVGTLLNPEEVRSEELREFADESCWPFFVKKKFGARRRGGWTGGTVRRCRIRPNSLRRSSTRRTRRPNE